MKGIVIDLKDISDSREVMESKESPKIRCFIYIMFAVLVTFVLFACFLKIDEYSRVTGEIRTVEALSSVITTNNCKIEKILVDEGQKVNQGDILYVLDSDYYQEQKKIIEDKLVKYNADLENTKLLKQSIEQDVNLFKNNESDSNYYYRFSQYKNGVLLTAKEFEQSNFSNSLTNEDNTKNLVAVNNSIKEKQSEKSSYQNMLNAVLSNYTYSGNNSTVNSIYDEYISNLQKSEMIYEEYIKQFSYLSKMIDEQSDMELITSEQLQTARSEYENTYSLMEKYTSSYITEIKMKIVVLENQLVEEDNKTTETEGVDIIETQIHEENNELLNTINQYKQLLSAVENNLPFSSEIADIQEEYEKYKNELKSLSDDYLHKYSDYQTLYACFLEQSEKTIINQSDVDNAEYNCKNAEKDLETQKKSFVTQIQSKIDSLNEEIKSLESSKSKLETALKSDTDNKDYEELTTDKLKNEAIISINNEIDSINSNITSLKAQILEIDESINNCVIKATLDGTATLISELNVGSVVQAGNTLCSIIPNDNELKVILYIPEKEISKIKIGQETEYIIDAMPYSEYGRIKGTITSISADSIANEASGTKLYIAQASLNSDSLTNSAGETRYVKNGMIVEAKAICGTKKVITWLLQKINFID